MIYFTIVNIQQTNDTPTDEKPIRTKCFQSLPTGLNLIRIYYNDNDALVHFRTEVQVKKQVHENGSQNFDFYVGIN